MKRKADEATAALKSPHAQESSVDGSHASPRRPNKRVEMHKISSPLFVSSSTSLEVLPLPASPSVGSGLGSPGPSKLSQRFRKLRGTLRAKTTASDVGDSQQQQQQQQGWSVDLGSPDPTTHSPNFAAQMNMAASSSTDLGRQQRMRALSPTPSTPQSAGPTLKGFMARLLKPRRGTDDGNDQDGMLRTLAVVSPQPSNVSPPERSQWVQPQARPLNSANASVTGFHHSPSPPVAPSPRPTQQTSPADSDRGQYTPCPPLLSLSLVLTGRI